MARILGIARNAEAIAIKGKRYQMKSRLASGKTKAADEKREADLELEQEKRACSRWKLQRYHHLLAFS